MSSLGSCFHLLSCLSTSLSLISNLWKGREKQSYTYFFLLVVVSEFLFSISSGEQNFFDEIDMIETGLCVGRSWKMLFLLLFLSNRTHLKRSYYLLCRKIKSKRTYMIIKIIENGWKTTLLRHVFFTVPLLSYVATLGLGRPRCNHVVQKMLRPLHKARHWAIGIGNRNHSPINTRNRKYSPIGAGNRYYFLLPVV